jgi:ATP-dependent Clp protease protease subunit
MPLGVPKVAYRMAGDSVSQWVDLYNRLYRERLLFLASDLDDEISNQLVALLLYLNEEDASKKLYLFINSLGGSMTAGLSVFDAMNHCNEGVTTLSIGIAASMASFILAGGKVGSRIALPHSRVMIHQPMSASNGQASRVVAESKEVLRLRAQVGEIYAQRTGQSLMTIARDMDRDRYMSSNEARDYGIVDHVVQESERFKF